MTTLSIKLDDNRAKYLKKMSHYLRIERAGDVSAEIIKKYIENQRFND